MIHNPLDTPRILERYGIHPDQRLGQNFLIDPASLQRVVEAAEINQEDVVLEIGPGLGNLTCYLAQRARQVVAVELDRKLLKPLQEIIKMYPNVTLVQGDILAFNPTLLMQAAIANNTGYKVVANIPYNITSALLRHLLETKPPPSSLVLTVQKEVAERICAKPGDLSILALSVQVYGLPNIVAHIPAGSFYPSPKVDSAVVRVAITPQPAVPDEDLPIFFRLVKAGFSQKRKTLRNALAGGMRWEPQQAQAILQQANIDPRRRAETLSMDEWKNLVQVLKNQPAA